MRKIIDFLFGGSLFKGDKGVWMIYFFLCMVSLVEVYSASSRLTFAGGHHWTPMLNQAGFLFLGFLVILLFHRIPCKWFMLFPLILMPLALILLVYTAVLGGGGTVNETNRWVRLGFISFQPSEVAKAALLMTTAVVLAKTQAERVIQRGDGKRKVVVGAIKGKRHLAFAIIGITTLVTCGLIFMDNVSTALMLLFVVIIMMFVGRVPRILMFKGLLGLASVGAFVALVSFAVPEETLSSVPMCKRLVTVRHRIERMANLGDKAEDTASGKSKTQQLLSDKNSQSTYAAIAIANSDVIGLGPGNSIQRDFLQHAESDFIFAIIIEELGVAGAVFVACLYLTLLIRVCRIAQRCAGFFPAYLVLGFGVMMVLQAFVNMSVAVGLVPVTGQTLPLISKGGTSIVITSFYIGVILSVSRHAEKKEQNAPQVAAQPNHETSEYYTDGGMT